MFPDRVVTARLVLRPIAAGDAHAIFDTYAQDPEVTRYLTWLPHRRIEETSAYIATCLAAITFRTYAMTRRTDAQLIGAFDLRQETPWRQGFGYALARPAWGQGLMTEALTAVVDWALAQPSIWRIGDVADVENPASARVMEKAGLALEGIRHGWSVHPNLGATPRDCYSYAKVRGRG